MAQTRKRRRKHRGTQGGKIDQRRSRPRSRAEARAQAKTRGRSKKGKPGPRQQGPPTWRGATLRGAAAAGIFFLLMLVIFKRPPAQAISLGVFMLAIYIPLGYFIDSVLYRRRQTRKQRERDKDPG